VEVQLEIQRLEAAAWVILSATGEIDLATVGKLESAIEAVLHEGTKRLVIDLNDVSFLDSTGLRTLLAAHAKLEELGGSLAVVVAGGPVQRLLDITGIGSTMNVYPSVEAATV
jgi:anti-sigma B factor antagonist